MCSMNPKLGSSSGRRQFLNLIVAGSSPGVKSVRRINLAQLFYRDTPPPPPPPSKTMTVMETLSLPPRTFTLRALNNSWNLHCFPFAGRKVICGDDQSGFSFIFDVDTLRVATMPPLSKKMPKVNPVSVFVHKPHVDEDICNYDDGSSLFLMERIPRPELISNEAPVSEQFVGFVNHYPSGLWGDKCFTGRLLPPPPFVRETPSWYENTPEITACGVVGGGGGSQHVCISVEGVGTYCLDTGTACADDRWNGKPADYTWSQVGKWTLPFRGTVEYVPELKLWFGLSGDGESRHLAAADLSDVMDSRPCQLVGGPWKELVDPPKEWEECKDAQIVNLGSGRFCIARFFLQGTGSGSVRVVHKKKLTVLTGVEVNSCSGQGEGSTGKVELQMIPHRSRRVINSSIEALF